MLGDHVNLQLKRGVKILTCDPTTRLVEAETRNGEVIIVNVYSYTPMFRWPIPGEKWVVNEQNGSWFLDGIYEPQGITGGEIQAEPGDAILSSSSGRVLLNQEGQLTEIKSSKFALIEKYVKQKGPFFYNTIYTPSKEFVTLAVISPGFQNPGFVFIGGEEVAEIEFHGSVVPMTFIIPKDTTWEIKAIGSTELKSVAYAFFPS